jgi:peptide/nickel transport system permease protein
VTLELGFFAMLISVITALPVGIYSAIRQDTLGDYMGRGIAIVFISVPLFWTATMVMIYPALWWGWAPPLELIPFERDPLGHLGMFILRMRPAGEGCSVGKDADTWRWPRG